MNKGTSIVGFILCFLAGSMFMYGVDHQKGGGAEADEQDGAGTDQRGLGAVGSSRDHRCRTRT